MPRKRTPDQPSTEVEPQTTTATVEPTAVELGEQQQTFAERVGKRKQWVPGPDPFEIAGDYLAGVRLFESKRDRQMAIKFDEKPSQAVIDKLKDEGFRWNPDDKIWAHPVWPASAMSTRIRAERLYRDVCQMIRQEKGIEAGQEIPF